MVKRKNLHSVSKIAGAVSATAPSGSAALTDLQIAYLPPERLRLSPNNARTHSKKQLKQIARSIERFGFVNPVLISDDFEIIAGHGRVEAAKMLGLRQVPTVRLSNLSPAERRAYVIADNRLAELAGWDRELLASELQGLLELQFDDIELTGFSLGKIDLLLDEAAEKKAEEPGPEDELPANSLQGPAVSKPRDLWILGPHRLLCGELDPLSCDVIVRRWQQYTGKAARLEGSDLTFEDVAATRLAEPSACTARADGVCDMSEKSNPTRGEPPESQPNESEGAPAEEYQVGPGRPPADKRWKKGGPSPNPRGRPRKEQSMLPDVRKAFEQAVNKKVSVTRGDKKVLMTRIEIGFEQLFNQFAKGDRYARRDLMEYADKLDIDFLDKHKKTLEEALTPNYQAILDAYFARRSGAADVAPAPRVLAPSELLDDDPAETEPTLPSPPTAVTKPEPEPEPPQKPNVKYPKPFSRMTRMERQAWYPEWYAKKAAEEQEKQRAKEKAKVATENAKERPAAQKLDQASLGRGRPPPGGFSVTTGKWT